MVVRLLISIVVVRRLLFSRRSRYFEALDQYFSGCEIQGSKDPSPTHHHRRDDDDAADADRGRMDDVRNKKLTSVFKLTRQHSSPANKREEV